MHGGPVPLRCMVVVSARIGIGSLRTVIFDLKRQKWTNSTVCLRLACLKTRRSADPALTTEDLVIIPLSREIRSRHGHDDAGGRQLNPGILVPDADGRIMLNACL